jgi:uncharacterized protein YhbP (UPF0306 family)
MSIERSKRRVAAARMAAMTRDLLDAAPLCSIATVARGGGAYVNTAYFACSPEFDLVWLSEPQATHSGNIRVNRTVAIAVYDSNQSWGKPDRGIQLFGTAREAEGEAPRISQTVYERRFPDYRQLDFSAYRFYRFRPRRLKLFDERELGAGVFVTAKVGGGGRLTWERTDVYRSTSKQLQA